MADTQNPVYVDGTTITGDGTIEHPLAGAGGGASPGGAAGDIQINDGAGGFTNAAGRHASNFANFDTSGNLTLHAFNGVEIEALGGAGMTIATLLAGMMLTAGGNIISINGGFASGSVVIGNSTGEVSIRGAIIDIPNLPVFANNAAAILGGLVAGNCYRTGADPDFIAVVH